MPCLDRLRAVMAALADVGERLEGQSATGDGDPDAARERLVAAQRIELISMLEWLKSTAAAAQARLTDAFARSQQPDAGASASDHAQARRSVRAQIGLARRDSPHRAARLVNLAAVLVRQMPGVLGALARGHTSEWRARLIVQETRHLSAEQRAQVDAAIADQLVNWGDAQTQRQVRAWACRLDPHGAAARTANAAKDRRVSIRPAPDSMTYLTALMPVKDGVACYAALHRHANLANANGDDHRSRGQVMADGLVHRLLHPAQQSDTAGRPAAPPGPGQHAERVEGTSETDNARGAPEVIDTDEPGDHHEQTGRPGIGDLASAIRAHRRSPLRPGPCCTW